MRQGKGSVHRTQSTAPMFIHCDWSMYAAAPAPGSRDPGPAFSAWLFPRPAIVAASYYVEALQFVLTPSQ